MALIVGSFETQGRAERALTRLYEAGVEQDEAVLIANARGVSGETSETGALAAREAAATAEPTAAASEAATAADEDKAPEAITDPRAGEAGTAGAAGAVGSAETNVTEKEAEGSVNSAALGAAVGMFAGGGVMGPLGLALGAAVGTGVGLAASLVSRGLGSSEAESSEADIMAGKYLVVVETDRKPAAEVRALFEESDVEQVEVKA